MIDFTEAVQGKSSNELLKMVYQFDQWSPSMLSTVESELLNRGILPTDIEQRKQKLIDAEAKILSKGKDASLTGQIIGWLTVFGLIGMMLGYNYAYSKVKSKYSEKSYFKYNEVSRKNGSYLFYTSLILSALTIFFYILKQGGANI